MTADKNIKGYRNWEYAIHGDYHRNLDPSWCYTPTYFRKLKFVRNLIHKLRIEAHIPDAGEGV
jgi:hypothetical protein